MSEISPEDGPSAAPLTMHEIRGRLAALWPSVDLDPEHHESFHEAEPAVLAALMESLDRQPSWEKVRAVCLVMGMDPDPSPDPLSATAQPLLEALAGMGVGGNAKDQLRALAVVLSMRLQRLLGTAVRGYLSPIDTLRLLLEDAVEELLGVLDEVQRIEDLLDVLPERLSFGHGSFVRRLSLRIYAYASLGYSIEEYVKKALDGLGDRLPPQPVADLLTILRDSPHARLFRGLRNVVVHHHLLPVTPFPKFGGESLAGSVFINPAELRGMRTAKDWGAALELLENGEPLLDLRELVVHHAGSVLSAVDTFVQACQSALRQEIDEADAEEARLKDVNRAMSRPG